MPKPKQSFLVNAVKAYIQMKVAKSGSQSVPLESERKLEQRFGISRPTIHQAMEELVEDGWCLKLPGKRFLYSNPARSNPIVRNVGIFSGNLFSNSFSSLSSLSGFIQTLSDNRTFIHFCQLYSQEPDRMFRELENMGLDGVLFMISGDISDDALRFIRSVIGHGIPAVGLSREFDFSVPDLPADNCVLYDGKTALRHRAETVRKLGFRRIAMVSGEAGAAFFDQCIGGRLISGAVVCDLPEIPVRLPEMIRSGNPDLLIIDGGLDRYRTVFRTLDNFQGDIPDLMVYQQAVLLDPGLRKRFRIHLMDDAEPEFERGASAAEKLIRMMDR